MSVQQELNRQLSQLPPYVNGSGPNASGPRQVGVDVEGGRLECEVQQVDEVGCAVDKLELRTDRLRASGPEQLRRVSERLSERVRYLLEPIAPVECDAEAGQIRMRSNPPTRDSDGVKYYELDVSGQDGIVMSRFHARPGESRQNIPAHFTREALGRLADDIVSATSPE